MTSEESAIGEQYLRLSVQQVHISSIGGNGRIKDDFFAQGDQVCHEEGAALDDPWNQAIAGQYIKNFLVISA